MTEPTIDDVFELLGKWRHLPDYQLERRADIYFALFLPYVLEQHSGTPINPLMIPEFPIRKPGDNLSFKVDYFAISNDRTRAFFIELKTDMGSQRAGQNQALDGLSKRKLCDILIDFRSLAGAKSRSKQDRQKYFHLLQALESLELIDMPPRLQSVMYATVSRDVFKLIDDIQVKNCDFNPEIIYVLPAPQPGKDVIDFAEFAHRIKGKGGLGESFAQSLTEWATLAPGSQ